MLVRQLFAMLVTLALLTPFAQAQGPYESVDPSHQTVRFWHQHGGAREAGLNAVVEAFNASNPYGIRVAAEYQGGYTEVFQKMLLLIGTSDAPNLVVAYQDQAAAYQFVEGLIDLQTFVDSPRWGFSAAELSDFFPGFIASDLHPLFNNQLLGFPPNRSIEVLYANLDWVRELGSESPPASPAAFEALACAATAQPFSRSVTGGASLGYELTLDASRFASWTFAFGGDIYDIEANRYTLDSDAAVAAMNFLQSLFAKGCAAITTERFGDQTNFGLGTTLFNVGSSSALPFYRSAVGAGADFDWSVAAVPHTTAEPVMNVYGASVSVARSASREAELATWLFVRYFTSPEAQAAWARASNYFPVRASVAQGLSEYFAEEPAYGAAFELLPYGISEPVAPGYAFVRELIAAEMAAIVEGAPVRESLARLNLEANQILDEQLADLD